MEMRVIVFCLTLMSIARHVDSENRGQFYGGSISYSVDKLDNGKNVANIELVTGWVLGRGPCGPGCDKGDIGHETRTTRQTFIAATGDPLYFGNYSSDFLQTSSGSDQTIELPQNVAMQANYTEMVLGVSEHAKWEQELLKFSLVLQDNKPYEDFNFQGKSWRNLTLQGNDLMWHMQARIQTQIRSDTNKSNNCPQVLSRPFYRVKLNTKSLIKIPIIDKDNDPIKCVLSRFIEGGELSDRQAPGVSILKEPVGECTVEVDTTDPQYKDDVWIGIPVTIRDYPKEDIKFGNQFYNEGQISMCATCIQFVVNVRENLITPEFVPPTLEANHEFYLYAETTWTIRLYAQAPENTTIDDFMGYGRSMEKYELSDKVDVPSQPRVRYTEVSWSPAQGDIGRHIACFSCTDNTGVDSAEQRCFILNVKPDSFNHTHSSNASGMSFVDIPSPDELIQCPIDSTCIIPIFVKSPQAVVKISIKESFSDESKIGNVTQVTHNGEIMYKADLSFSHSLSTQVDICFLATDVQGKQSDKVCIKSEIESKDPCLSGPCKNSAKCIRGNATGSFVCECPDGIEGRLCDHVKEFCESHPCYHGAICFNSRKTFVCQCRGTGYTGRQCDIKTDHCKSKDCSGHGICVDGTQDYKCDCHSRYNGTDCENDTCPAASPSLTKCPTSECLTSPCGSHGVCSAGPTCTCSIGYTDTHCGTGIGDVSSLVTGVEFLPPSPTDGSKLTCYMTGDTVSDCTFSIYLGTSAGTAPSVTADSTSDLFSLTTISSITDSASLPGIQHLFTGDVTLAGSFNDTTNKFLCLHATLKDDTDKLCLELDFVKSPLLDPRSKEYKQKGAAIQFLPPTPLANSRLVCEVNTSCSLLLYTTKNGSCVDVITTTQHVTAFPARDDGTKGCVTEVVCVFPTAEERDMCFRSSTTDFQERCFKVDVYGHLTNPCSSSPCQNGGQCFIDGHGQYKCYCKEGYTEDTCEKGPCPTNDCQNGGYCAVNNHVTTCMCPVGYSDPKCATETKTTNTDTHNNGAVITDTLKTVDVYCSKNIPCSATLLLAGLYTAGTGPDVQYGYVSSELVTQKLDIMAQGSTGSYEASIYFIGKVIGDFQLCIQTLNENRINKDEACVNVHITFGSSSLYGFIDRPHFVPPSPPEDTVVECKVGNQCRMIYHVISGVGHEQECTAAMISENPDFDSIHLFSCDTCVDGPGAVANCTLDVSFVPSSGDVGSGKTVCVTVSLKTSGTVGEKRCFKVNVKDASTPVVRTGCQTLHCENGGFCDGQDRDNPVCFCALGFSGHTCNETKQSPGSSNSQSFIGDKGIPSEIPCSQGCTCHVPFQVLATTVNSPPTVTLGYVDPRLDAKKPELLTKSATSVSLDFNGVVDVTLTEAGTFIMCLQIKKADLTEDEICFMILDTGSCGDQVDQDTPHFLPPTLPADSVVLCTKGKPCHVQTFFTQGETFGMPGACPSVKDTSNPALIGVHIFRSEHNVNYCNNDVTYVTPSTTANNEEHVLCLQLSLPGMRGEDRCFALRIADDVTSNIQQPCKGVTCANEGVCTTNMTSQIGVCVCQAGHQDSTCSSVDTTTKYSPGVHNPPTTTAGTPHLDLSHTLPTNVTCDVNKSCQIRIPYIGTTDKPPLSGYIDPNLTPNGTVVTTPDPNHPDHHVLVTTVTGPVGEHRLCFQTTVDGLKDGMNVDEHCLTTHIQTPGSNSSPAGQKTPSFNSNNPQDNSSLLCLEHTSCHHTVITDKAPNDTCAQVKECGAGIVGLHVFDTQEVGGQCVTELGITTTGSSLQTLCLTAGRPDGETRHYQLETKTDTTPKGCQGLHCENGAFCEARDPANPVCWCTQGRSGTNCSNGTTTTTDLPGLTNPASAHPDTPHFTSVSTIPTSVNCVESKPCQVVIPYTGDVNKPPLSGYTDPRLTKGNYSVLTPDPTHPERHLLVATVTGPTGSHKMCFQTTGQGLSTGPNIDEHCLTTKVNPTASTPAPPDPSKPTFSTETPGGNSSFQCPEHSNCHQTVITDKPSGGTCSQVEICPSGSVNAHVFLTKEVDGRCVTDVSIKTDAPATQTLCLVAGNPGGEKREYNVETKTETTPKGCQSLQCVNGGLCDGHDAAHPVCFCPSGYTDNTCSTPKTYSPSGSGNPSQTFIGDKGTAKEVTCGLGCVCHVPFNIIGKSTTNPPTVTLGYSDPRLHASKPQLVAQPTGTTSTSYDGVVDVTVTVTGAFNLCLQVKDGTTADDELCFKISDKGTCESTVNMTAPYFLPPTLPGGSSVLCEKGKSCYLQLHVTNGEKFGQAGVCPSITQSMAQPFEGVRVFPPRHNALDCLADVIYVPSTSAADNEKHVICVQLALSGNAGEQRCFTLTVTNDIQSAVKHPCRGVSCDHGGACLSDVTTDTGTCVCTSGYSGPGCSSATTTGTDLPGITDPPASNTSAPHFIPAGANPVNVTCVERRDCSILVPFTGDKDKPPIPGYIDPAVNISSLKVITPDPAKPDQHVLVATVTGTGGSHKLCFQTTNNGSKEGVNVDELCMHATMNPPGSNPVSPDSAKPTFFSHSAGDNSSFLCPENGNCHHTIYTQKPPGGQCGQVTECGQGISGLHVFETQAVGDHCVTEVGIATGGPKTEAMCISAGYPGGEERHYILETKTPAGFGPCQRLHCINGGSCLARTDTPVCACKPGYTGETCDKDIDYCALDPCQNNGTCVDGLTSYTCQCLLGFNGTNCENNINDCSATSCQNNGTCVDGVNNFTCNCITGFTGRQCETNINDCSATSCQNNGTCVDGVNNFTCNCITGFTDRQCETNINDCSATSCQNNGTCVDGVNNFTCNCLTGFTGRQCETNINDCSATSCQNNGTCVDGVNNFTCNCITGFTDRQCETNINDCATNPCKNNATCVDGINAYTCQCPQGYEGDNCQTDINECTSNPCQNSGTCQDGINKFTCTCVLGYTGDMCETDINDCLPGPCKNGATCTDRLNGFTCHCDVGYTGTTCEDEIDDCQSLPCKHGATCHDAHNNYTCTCPAGFEGRNCENDVDNCATDPCQNGGTCVDGIDSYTCTCPRTHEGVDCEHVSTRDDCVPTNNCQNGGTCLDGVNNYTCRCLPGFTGYYCDTEIDECLPVPCENDGTCHDHVNGYTCTCAPGYSGTNCQIDINECDSGPCQNSGTCQDHVNGYTCTCPVGYNGNNCQLNIDECSPNPCLHAGTCTDGINDFTCLCPPGYTDKRCDQDIDECASGPCQNHGTCHQGVNTYTCTCPPGYSGTRCEVDIDECLLSPCQHFGTCQEDVADYTCTCIPGYTGHDCEIDINECASVTCQHGGTCVDEINSYSCNCLTGWEGIHCETQTNIDECASNPCKNGTCHDLTNNYTCSCFPGYTGINCQNEINRCDSNPCKNGASCIGAFNNYTCACEAGFSGRDCDIDVNECGSSPCINGGTCQDQTNAYTCHCPSGYSGQNCETDVDECSPDPCLHGTCQDRVNGFQCTCHPGFSGQRCDQGSAPKHCVSSPCKNGATCIEGITSFSCTCRPGFTGTTCDQENLSTLHNVSPIDGQNQSPAFTQYTIPEVVKCPVNQTCSIILPVAAAPGQTPVAQNGHFSPSLHVVDPVTQGTPSCVNGVCYHPILISVKPTLVGMFKYCVQTLDTNHVNADELCYMIDSYLLVGSQLPSRFVQPPTMPNYSTMACTVNTTCHYTIVTKSPCPPDFKAEGNQAEIFVSPPTPIGGNCEYKVLVSPNMTQIGHNITMCFRLEPNDRHCTYIHVQDKSEIERRTGQCYQHHCAHGGFCDSSDPAQSSCVCTPGYHGPECTSVLDCSIGSIPESVTCSDPTDCSVHFVATGLPPQFSVPAARSTPLQDGNSFMAEVPVQAPETCFRVLVNRGGCSTTACVKVTNVSSVTPAIPGEITPTKPVLSCKELTGSASCKPLTVVMEPFANHTCPPLAVDKDSTMRNVHVFDSSLVNGKCFATVVAKPGLKPTSTDQLCLVPGDSAKTCLTVWKSDQGTCDQKEAKSQAVDQVDKGLATCSCNVQGKMVVIIKKKPTVPKETLYKAAGFGAGGSVGVLVLAVGFYLVISKMKGGTGGGRKKPLPRPPSLSTVSPYQTRKRNVWA